MGLNRNLKMRRLKRKLLFLNREKKVEEDKAATTYDKVKAQFMQK